MRIRRKGCVQTERELPDFSRRAKSVFFFKQKTAYEIVDGKRGRMLKNATYAGITPEFWNSCDAVAGRTEWRVWGLANCGKGQPPQVAHVAHGAAPARFQHVKVGILK